ncbi:MAG: hypothetical protein WDO15_04300 [Bacteroidota bacterium]
MIVGVYGIVQLVYAIREKKIADFAKTSGILVGAVVIAVGNGVWTTVGSIGGSQRIRAGEERS